MYVHLPSPATISLRTVVHLLVFGCCLCLFLPGSAQLRFVQNGGQWPDQVQFGAEVEGGNLFVEDRAITWSFVQQPAAVRAHGHESQRLTDPHQDKLLGHAYRIHFEGARHPLQFIPKQKLPGKTNYFLGADPKKWAGDLNAFEQIEGEWSPGVQIVIFSSGGNMKYDFVLQPGFGQKEIRKLRFRYEGAESIKLEEGRLKITTSVNHVVEAQPYAWQNTPEGIKIVNCRYTLKGNRVGFEFPDGYDSRYEMVLDPASWIFGSYSGSTADNWGYSAAYDSEGNLFGAGIVFGTGYPVTLGAYESVFSGGSCDIGITKFSADGTTNIWSTYIGGNSAELPHSIIANANDELWIFGTTGSTDFPTTAGAYDDSFNGGTSSLITGVNFNVGSDIYVSRLSADGSALLASTFVGGSLNDGHNTSGDTQFNYGDHARGEIIVDEEGNAYVGSCTFSADFPTTAGSFSEFNAGGQDGVVFKLDSACTALEWSSYIGGVVGDAICSIKLEADENVLMTGGTGSDNFPVTPLSIDTSFADGNTDGWIGRLSADGSTLLHSSYVGTSAYDQSYFVEFDAEGAVYITGQSLGAFPVSPGVYSNPGSGQFILKLSHDLDSVIYSTVYGSGNSFFDISPTAFLVDVCGNVYISGWGGTTNTPGGNTFGLPVTPDAVQSSTDGSDFYYSVFTRDMQDLEYATFYGGGVSREHVDGGTSRFDRQGAIYQAVCAGCGGSSDFPTTAGAWSNTNNASNCNLGVSKFSLDFAGVFAGIGAPAVGCAPLEIDFVNTSTPGADYIWDFGGGDVTGIFEPTRTYTDVGTYTVKLVVIDSASCNISDTAIIEINVHEDSVEADFDVMEIDYCDSVLVDFTNESEFVTLASYVWNFGDGFFSFEEHPSHTFTFPGTFTISLIVSDPTSCNIWDTAYYEVTVLPRTVADFIVPPGGCAPYSSVFVNLSAGVFPSFQWNFGDGTTSGTINPAHVYNSAGSYTVTLVVTDPGSCNLTDTFSTLVDVYPLPAAAFDAMPEIGSVFQDFEFEDLSTDNIVMWEWDFGDGSTSDQQNPTHIYTQTGLYEVCLKVINDSGCEDSICIQVLTDSTSQLLFPSAFSPNGDGQNDIFVPFNWGLDSYLLKIYNRWGELVFETSIQDDGWDGTWKGKEQDQGMYKVVASGDGLDGVRYRAVSDLFLVR